MAQLINFLLRTHEDLSFAVQKPHKSLVWYYTSRTLALGRRSGRQEGVDPLRVRASQSSCKGRAMIPDSMRTLSQKIRWKAIDEDM